MLWALALRVSDQKPGSALWRPEPVCAGSHLGRARPASQLRTQSQIACGSPPCEAIVSSSDSPWVLRMLLPTVAQQCYIEAEGLGHGAKDLSAVILPMEAIAGVKVARGGADVEHP